MDENVLDIKILLDIIFKITRKNARILADRYLIKDVSIISKWKNHKVCVKDNDISGIVEFAVNESSELQRKIMRGKIEGLLNNSNINEELKKIILNTGTFHEFLIEVLNISTTVPTHIKKFKKLIPNAGIDEISNQNNEYGDENVDETDLKVNIESKYSGIINFDLILINKKGDGEKNISSKPDMNIIIVSTSLIKQTE